MPLSRQATVPTPLTMWLAIRQCCVLRPCATNGEDIAATSLHSSWPGLSRPTPSFARKARKTWITGTTNPVMTTSIHRDPGELDHLSPLLGLISDELAELGRRHRLRNSADFGKPRDQLGIFQRFADRLVEDFHDLRRGAFRRGDAVETDRLEAGHGL